jgi:hypothetical protein
MTGQPRQTPVTLDRLRSQGALERLTVVAPGEPGRTVQQVVLADSLDRLGRLAPDSLILLTGDAAAGGWAVAAALRTAWERRAAGLVAPASTCGPAAAPLAERLELALFSTSSSMFDLALELAIEVGTPAALRDRRVARTATMLADQRSVVAIVRTLNEQLEVPVALTAAGQLITGDDTAVAAAAGEELVSVAVSGPDGAPWAKLVAVVPKTASSAASDVDGVFRLARAPIAAILARARLNSARKIQREQLAFRRLRSSVAGLSSNETGSAELADGFADTLRTEPHSSGDQTWQLDGEIVGVYLTDPSAPDELPSLDVTTMVTDAWAARLPTVPLVVGDDGWISWFDARSETTPSDVAKQLRRRFAAEAGVHRISMGVGTRLHGAAGLVASVDQARLAARAGAPGTVSRFDQLGVATVLASLRSAEIVSIGRMALPDLFAAKDAGSLIQTLLTVLDCGGSLGQAATRLGVHRNTVLARVARAREMGAEIDDPDSRLALHVLCHAVETERNSGREPG